MHMCMYLAVCLCLLLSFVALYESTIAVYRHRVLLLSTTLQLQSHANSNGDLTRSCCCCVYATFCLVSFPRTEYSRIRIRTAHSDAGNWRQWQPHHLLRLILAPVTTCAGTTTSIFVWSEQASLIASRESTATLNWSETILVVKATRTDN